jgi:predicted ATPase/DNA-binding SARP family transcriptional activator/DNA-binding XRE family transcriptional regulator
MAEWAQFGDLVRARRQQVGMSQEQLAALAGLSVRTLRDIERGRIRSARRSVSDVARVLDLPCPSGPPTPAVAAIGVLGPLVIRVGGSEQVLGSPMQRSVLGLLAVQPGDVVYRDEMVDVLWGDRPPRSCTNLIQTYVARLRRALAAPELPTIESTPGGGYRLLVKPDADPPSVDALAFDATVTEARHTRDAGDRPAATALFARALDQWRGPVLADLGPRVRARPAVIARQRDWLTAVLEYADVAEPEAAAARLLATSAVEPLHEALHARLVRVLAASGQQAQALAVYTDVRLRLADELGIDPGPELRDAYATVLRQDQFTSAAAVPVSGVPVGAVPVGADRWLGPRGHLTHLVGRDRDTDDVLGLSHAHRLVTMTGPAGCGKTALAMTVADRWPDSVVVLALAGLSGVNDPVLALGRLLDIDGRSPADVLATACRRLDGPGTLLLVDNAEHLTGQVAALVGEVLGGCPGLTVLVTSRQPLGVSGEVVRQLDPLPVPDADEPSAATELFAERARQAWPSVDLSDTAAIGHLARRLDGLPLALELAAARVRALPVPQLADRLDLALEMRSDETVPTGRAHDRHRTLRSAIDWSYQLLTPSEQQVLAELSVFRGAFTAEAAEAVCRPGGRTLATMVSLVDQSLLVAERYGPASRFQLLETVREYAAARLAGTDADAVRQRHLDHWLDRSRLLAGNAEFAARIAQARQIGVDLPDAEAALAHAQAGGRWSDLLALAVQLADCWNVNPGYVARGIHWLSFAGTHGTACPPRLRAEARLCHAQLLGSTGHAREAMHGLYLALPDVPTLPPDRQVDLLSVLTSLELTQLDPTARRHAGQLLAAVTEVTDPDVRGAALDLALAVALEWHPTEHVDVLLDRCGHQVATSCRWLATSYLSNRAMHAVLAGDAVTARSAIEEANRVEPAVTSVSRRYTLCRITAVVLLAVGTDGEALDYLRDKAPRVDPVDSPIGARLLGVPYAEALRRAGHVEHARRVLADGLLAALDSGNHRAGLPGVLVAAALAEALGDHLCAAELTAADRSLRKHLDLPDPVGYPVPALDRGPARPTDEVERVLGRAVAWCRGETSPVLFRELLRTRP